MSRGGETYNLRDVTAPQIPTLMMMHMKKSWIIQNGMRTDFNQGDDLRVVAFAIVAAAEGMMATGAWK